MFKGAPREANGEVPQEACATMGEERAIKHFPEGFRPNVSSRGSSTRRYGPESAAHIVRTDNADLGARVRDCPRLTA